MKDPDSVKSVPSELLSMPIKRAILRLAWPAMVAGFLENLASTVDMVMVGRLGAAEIAAVGFCAMINWAVSSLVMGLSVAVTAIVARNYGAGDRGEANRSLALALILSLILSGGIAAVILAFAPAIMASFGVAADVYALSVPYLRIISVSGIFWGIISVASGALRGAGDVRTPLYIGLAKNIIHVSANYILIFGRLGLPALGVVGAAIGSTISALTAVVIYLYLLNSGMLRLRLSRSDFKWDSRRAWSIVRLGFPASAEQFVLEAGLLIYARFVVYFGTAALSGYQVGMQVLSLAFIPNMGFSAAAATLVGQNLGAVRKAEAKRAGWICLLYGTVSMSAVGLVGLLNAERIASVFIKDPIVVGIAAAFVWVVAISQPGMAVYYSLAGALRGAGDTRSPLWVTLFGMYGVRIPGVWLVTRVLRMGIRVAFSLTVYDYVVRVVAILYLYSRGKWLDREL